MPKFIDPVNISPTAGSWQTVDVTAHLGGDAGDVSGVILRAISNGVTEYSWGLQHPDSTDDRSAVLEDKSWVVASTGINSSDQFECYIENAQIEIWIEGYILNAEGSFVDDGIDKTPGSAGSYQLVDISSDTGGETAKVAIFQIHTTGIDSEFAAVPYNWTTDIRGDTNAGDLRYVWVGLDGSERCNIWVENTDCKLYLVGWLTDNVTVLSSLKDYSAGNDSTWTDADLSTDLPGTATGAFFAVGNLGSGYSEKRNTKCIYLLLSNTPTAR